MFNIARRLGSLASLVLYLLNWGAGSLFSIAGQLGTLVSVVTKLTNNWGHLLLAWNAKVQSLYAGLTFYKCIIQVVYYPRQISHHHLPLSFSAGTPGMSFMHSSNCPLFLFYSPTDAFPSPSALLKADQLPGDTLLAAVHQTNSIAFYKLTVTAIPTLN